MKKLTTVIMVLSLVLGGVALAAAADLNQTPNVADLNGFAKISDQEAQNLRGTGMGPMFSGFGGVGPSATCVPNNYNYTNSQYNTCIPKAYANTYLTPGPHKK